MPTVDNHLTIQGRLRGFKRSGGGVRTYAVDALASVVATVDSAGIVENSYRYKPYGQALSKVGAGQDYAFRWNGTNGYRSTSSGLLWAEVYVRARHYSSSLMRWTTVDPLWPRRAAYSYALGSPAVLVDPSGLSPCQSDCTRNPCAWADGQGISWDPAQGTFGGGYIVCCKEKCYACVNEADIEPSEKPEIHLCVKAHEKEHCAQVSCIGKPDGEPDLPDRGLGECEASAVEMSCLLKEAKKCERKGNDECLRRINERIPRLCKYALGWCAKVPKKFKYEQRCHEMGIYGG